MHVGPMWWLSPCHMTWCCSLHAMQNDLTMWQPAVCLNFMDELLTWIRKVVVEDGPR